MRGSPVRTGSYRASGNTRDQVEGGASSVGAGQGQTRLPRGLLGLAAQTPGRRLLAAATQLLRLSQARGKLCAEAGYVVRDVAIGDEIDLFFDLRG